MIIGSALGRLFKDMVLNINTVDVPIMFDYGNQDSLDLFISTMDKEGIDKFPLLFYVVREVKEFSDKKTCDTELIILTNTEPYWLSKKRTIETYDNVIEPLYQKVKKTLTSNAYTQILGERKDKFSYLDRPNYGIVEDKAEELQSSKESIGTDYVDARVIKINIEVKHNCIK